MPYVNIKVTKEDVTAEQKQRLIVGTTKLLKEVLNKDPQKTYVVIDEVDIDNWGVGEETVMQIRARERNESNEVRSKVSINYNLKTKNHER